MPNFSLCLQIFNEESNLIKAKQQKGRLGEDMTKTELNY